MGLGRVLLGQLHVCIYIDMYNKLTNSVKSFEKHLGIALCMYVRAIGAHRFNIVYGGPTTKKHFG